MKKISKLNDVAYHLINKVNKKKLKINTLLIKNWGEIFGINHHFVKIKKITLLGQTDSLNLEFKIDSSKSFELHSKNPEIKLKCEEILGIKVNKILFFQDVLSKKSLVNSVIKKNSSKKLKDVNNQQLNDIKDEEVRSIFKNISNKINE
ncbi:hypothetical protein OA525_00980 [Alphaproteobacteria bacterium]|nr:hypothetical protein [Alphaproteobacteria bacterium]